MVLALMSSILYEVFSVQKDFFTLPLSPGPEFVGRPLHSGDIGIWLVSSLDQNHLKQSNIAQFQSVIKCILLPTSNSGVSVAMPMLHNL